MSADRILDACAVPRSAERVCVFEHHPGAHGAHRAGGGAAVARVERAVPAAQQLDEGGAEHFVEDGVDDGVERARHVAQPDEGRDERRLEATRLAYDRHDVDDEERRPADDEDEEDDAEHLGRPLLRLHPVVLVDAVPLQQQEVGGLDGHVVLLHQVPQSLRLLLLVHYRTAADFLGALFRQLLHASVAVAEVVVVPVGASPGEGTGAGVPVGAGDRVAGSERRVVVASGPWTGVVGDVGETLAGRRGEPLVEPFAPRTEPLAPRGRVGAGVGEFLVLGARAIVPGPPLPPAG